MKEADLFEVTKYHTTITRNGEFVYGLKRSNQNTYPMVGIVKSYKTLKKVFYINGRYEGKYDSIWDLFFIGE